MKDISDGTKWVVRELFIQGLSVRFLHILTFIMIHDFGDSPD